MSPAAIMPERADGLDFATLVREHQSMVFSIAWHFLHERGLAEELSQEVFLELHRHRAKLESPQHVLHWLRKVAVHRSIDAARHRKCRPDVPLDAVPNLAGRERAGDPMLRDLLRRLVASLPKTPRMVVVLRYQEELEPAEIAELLGIPLGTVKSTLHRALATLRDKLVRTGGRTGL